MEQESLNYTTLNFMEEREEFMVLSNSDFDAKNSILKKSHFLKPSKTSIDDQKSKLSSNCFADIEPVTSLIENGLLKINFNGWRNPQQIWEIWLDKMVKIHKSTWVKTGIYESILSTKYGIDKRRTSEKLNCGLASKWCLDTKSFIFPWGEATITLEDMMVLGGYSVLGDSVLCTLETEEMKEIEKSLCDARIQVVRTKAKKACQSGWAKYFTEEERQYEHEAFLILWLSRFVFPSSFDVIIKEVFAIAIHLARGNKIALAPAVLACIYRDLGLLKQDIDNSISLQSSAGLTLWAPFHLVLIWIWERFETPRPGPDYVEHGSPRISRWYKKVTSEDTTLEFYSIGECFSWRPYTSKVTNWVFPRFYRETETRVLVDSYLNMEIESFIRCIRASELVGIDYIEQYLPHRVARQFGFDQDIPDDVARCNVSPQAAWEIYDKKLVFNTNIYLPSRVYEPRVTIRYTKWWAESVLFQKEQQSSLKRKQYDATTGPPGFPSIRNTVKSVDSSNSQGVEVAETFRTETAQECLKQKTRDDNMLVSPTIHLKDTTSKQIDSSSDEEDIKPLSQLYNLTGNVQVPCPNHDHVQIPSSLSCEDGKSDEKLEIFIAQDKENMSGDGEAATGRSDRVVVESASENSFTSAPIIPEIEMVSRNAIHTTPGVDVTETETVTRNAFETPGVDLESRINNLDRLFTALKEQGRFSL